MKHSGWVALALACGCSSPQPRVEPSVDVDPVADPSAQVAADPVLDAKKVVPMPAGAAWDGVYFDVQFGNLHLVAKDGVVTGKWRRPMKDRWGSLSGKVEGNRLDFEWEEHVNGETGPGAVKKGKGYFLYSRPAGTDVDDVLEGEIGTGEASKGTAWQAVKQRNMAPETDPGGGDWE